MAQLTLCGPPGTSDAGTRFQRMARAPGRSPRANPRLATGFRNRVCGRARTADDKGSSPNQEGGDLGRRAEARAADGAASLPGPAHPIGQASGREGGGPYGSIMEVDVT